MVRHAFTLVHAHNMYHAQTRCERRKVKVRVCVCCTDPEFVSSAFIQQSADGNPTGDDDKIYFFFTEVAKEYDLYTKVKVPRVARVCKVNPLS